VTVAAALTPDRCCEQGDEDVADQASVSCPTPGCGADICCTREEGAVSRTCADTDGDGVSDDAFDCSRPPARPGSILVDSPESTECLRAVCTPMICCTMATACSATNLAETRSFNGYTDDEKWNGVVLSDVNKKLYFIPSSATSVLVVDALEVTADDTTLSGLSAQPR